MLGDTCKQPLRYHDNRFCGGPYWTWHYELSPLENRNCLIFPKYKRWISCMLSTSIYDLVLIYVCHFHHHHHHRRNGCSTLSSIEILVLLSWIPASKEFFTKEIHFTVFQIFECCKYNLNTVSSFNPSSYSISFYIAEIMAINGKQ